MSDFKVLTTEEIETLQVDAALRLIGEYSALLSKYGRMIGEALSEKGKADIALHQLKNDKQTLIEMIRGLKVLVERS